MSFSGMSSGTDDETDVVSQKILVNGKPLSGEITLSRVIVSKSFNKIASAKLVFLDGSVSDRDFPLSDAETLKPGNEITVQLGYHGNVDTVYKGIIVTHSIKANMRGPSLLVIQAKDKAITLVGARKSACYVNQTDSAVIGKIAGKLSPSVDSTSFKHKQLMQVDATDWDFICTRAEANSMLVLTDDGKLVVKKPLTTGSPVFTATYGDNLFEFEAEMDARRQVKKVTSHSWDYTKQKLEESGSGSATFSENGDISSSKLASVIGKEITLSHPGHLTQKQLQDWSDAYALRSQLSKTVGRVRVEGNASVKPGVMITLKGVGDRFNGHVFVTGVLHTFDGDWLTDVQFGWKEEWFYTKENVMEKPAAGLLPGINGLMIGTVLSSDDDEDGGQYRVKVKVPTMPDVKEGIWARVATLDAGAKRGIFFRPQPEDEVVLGFLGDDPREPIILGYLHSKSKHESPLPEKKGAAQYGVVTKEGLKLIFDDSAKKMILIVPASSGQKSIVINDSGAIALKDEHQNSITMNDKGISIEAGLGGAIELKDKSQNTISLKPQGITIQSNAIVTIKGSLVKIN